MTVIATLGHGRQGEVARWLNTLTKEQLIELGGLDKAWYETPDETSSSIREIIRDWIEDHGGQRWYWSSITYAEFEE